MTTTTNQTPAQTPASSSATEAQAPGQGEAGQPGTPAVPPVTEVVANAPAGADAGTEAAAKAAAEKAAADQRAGIEKETTEKVQAKAKADMASAITSWQETVKADPTIGGEKYEATLVDVAAGIKAVGTEGLVKLLDATGLRHHPDVARAFAKIGSMLKEGTFRTGTAPAGKPKSIGEVLYDKSPSK